MKTFLRRSLLLPIMGTSLFLTGCEGAKYVVVYNNTPLSIEAVGWVPGSNNIPVSIAPHGRSTLKLGYDYDNLIVKSRKLVFDYSLIDFRVLAKEYSTSGPTWGTIRVQVNANGAYLIKPHMLLPQDDQSLRSDAIRLDASPFEWPVRSPQ